MKRFDKLRKFKSDRIEFWADNLNSFHDEDGLFKDPVVSNSKYIDCDWWRWKHLTCLSQIAKKNLNF